MINKMQNNKRLMCIVFLFIVRLTSLQAQETIPASGGNATGSGGSVSYTVGQVVYTTNVGADGSVAQGVQQPYEISVVTGVDQFKNVTLTCRAYPNPTTDFLTLEIVGEMPEHFSASLYDLNGKLLQWLKVIGRETTIPMETLAPATYFLKIEAKTNSTSNNLKTFKIIKH
jgi:hypothetical protein